MQHTQPQRSVQAVVFSRFGGKLTKEASSKLKVGAQVAAFNAKLSSVTAAVEAMRTRELDWNKPQDRQEVCKLVVEVECLKKKCPGVPLDDLEAKVLSMRTLSLNHFQAQSGEILQKLIALERPWDPAFVAQLAGVPQFAPLCSFAHATCGVTRGPCGPCRSLRAGSSNTVAGRRRAVSSALHPNVSLSELAKSSV